jgi:FkbM family methyltransferase
MRRIRWRRQNDGTVQPNEHSSMVLKDAAKRFARVLGLELRRFHPSSSYAAQLRSILLTHGVNLIFDVGANVGQYGRELRWHVGYNGRIVSFEPLRVAHNALIRTAAGDSLWEVAEPTAIGAKRGSISLNVSANSVSSSVLPMLTSHINAVPESRYTGTELVQVVPLDVVAPKYFREGTVAFLKIDTQGYESQVLQGAVEILSRVVGVQLELSLVPLYGGQKLMPEMIESMKSAGFELSAIAPTFTDPHTGRTLQVDAIFLSAPNVRIFT